MHIYFFANIEIFFLLQNNRFLTILYNKYMNIRNNFKTWILCLKKIVLKTFRAIYIFICENNVNEISKISFENKNNSKICCKIF